jgi:hypothetical protein
MNVTTASLERINQHWAIQAIGEEQIKKAIELSNRLLVEKAVGAQIRFNYTFSHSDYELLERVSMAYEMAAIEGINDFLNPTSSEKELREQCATAAYRAFEIRRLSRCLLLMSRKSSIFYISPHWLIAETDGLTCVAGTMKTNVSFRFLLLQMFLGIVVYSSSVRMLGASFQEKTLGRS